MEPRTERSGVACSVTRAVAGHHDGLRHHGWNLSQSLERDDRVLRSGATKIIIAIEWPFVQVLSSLQLPRSELPCEHTIVGERSGTSIMGERVRGEGSLVRIYGPKDPATGEKKLVSKNWFAQYYDNDGKQRRVATGTHVQVRASAFLRKLLTDRDAGVPSNHTRKLTYADLRKGLLDNYMERGNKSLKTTSDGDETINGLKQLDEFFGYGEKNPGPRASSISTEVSRNFARHRLEQNLSTATVNRSLACLRRMLRIAYDDKLITFMPKIRMLKEPPARKGFLDLEKFEELLALLPTDLRTIVTLLYYCGVRLGEALSMEWHQVNLTTRLIRLEGEQTKNSEARFIPLPAPLVLMLSESETKSGRVFDGTNLRNEWQKACDACGLGTRTLVKIKGRAPWYRYDGLIIHDLRRSAVRNLVNAGVSEKVAMTITGHKTRAVFDRYHIVSTDDVSAAMRRVELGRGESSVKVTLNVTTPKARKSLKAKGAGL